MTDRIRIMLEDLEAVRENLHALSDDPGKGAAQNACRDAERGLIR